MARLSEKEIERIRKEHGIKPEDIGKRNSYHPPRGVRMASQPPEWVYTLITK